MNIVIINKDQAPMDIPSVFFNESAVVVSYDAETCPEIPGAKSTALGAHPPGFYAGANRNHGLATSYHTYGKSGHVLFLDGDRVPDRYDPLLIAKTLAKYNADALLFTCHTDPRAIARANVLDGLVDTGCLVSEFFSCGFVLSDKAIEAVIKENGGFLFHPAFDGHWGEEDKFLGIQLHNLGFKTCFTNAIKLGGGPLGEPRMHPDYRISLQTRINLMLENHYPMRHIDAYAHLENDGAGNVIKVYDGLQKSR